MPLTEPQQHHKAYEQAFNAGDADGILALFEENGLQAAGEAQRRGAEFRARLEDQFARGGVGDSEHDAGVGGERDRADAFGLGAADEGRRGSGADADGARSRGAAAAE